MRCVTNMKCVLLVLIISLIQETQQDKADDIYARQKYNQWFKDGVELIENNLNIKRIEKKAKGVIIFIGDGMGPTTITAGRILDGQLKNKSGEDNILSWETFPNVALSKTYNTDAITGDSAGTATAMMTGVKARAGVISVNDKVPRGNCTASKGQAVLSLIMMAEMAGMSTGVVSTARITHATPATAYAHSANRDWEADSDLKDKNCKDIATQLIDFPYGNGLEIAFGGGRKNFFPKSSTDIRKGTCTGERNDNVNLVDKWKNKSNDKKKAYVMNKNGFQNLDASKVDQVLGLFNCNHMKYSYYQQNVSSDEPSLTEMVEFAIKLLSKNEKGYVLLVEAGRIDHGHHGNKARLALYDTVELGKTVEKAKEITKSDDTLLILTADHSHVFTLGGYQARGSDIFGYTNQKHFKGKDNKRFTSLGYFNGPGAENNDIRKQPTLDQLKDPDFRFQSLVPLSSETHGGEDVGIYARGPQAHLIRGVVEQNYIFHVMDYALCLSESKKKICIKNGVLSARRTSAASHRCSWNKVLLICILSIFNSLVIQNTLF